MCFAFISRFDDMNNELLLTLCIFHHSFYCYLFFLPPNSTPDINLITITREKGPLDEVQAATSATAGGSRGTEPKVMHHGHPHREAAVGHK